MTTITEDGYYVYTRYYQTKQLELDTEIEVQFKNCWKKVNAVWDTGVTRTIVSEDLAKKLQLKKVADTRMNTASGEVKTKKYFVDIKLPNGCIVKNIIVSSGNFSTEDVDVLIGMDIITLGDMAISNLEGKTVFTFRMPPGDVIDFAKR